MGGLLRTIRDGLVGVGILAGRILSVAAPWWRWVLCSCLTFHMGLAFRLMHGRVSGASSLGACRVVWRVVLAERRDT